MKRTVLGIVLVGMTLAGTTSVAGAGPGGLGFHTTDAPIGVRHWFTDKIGGDLGVGYITSKEEIGATENKSATSSAEIGLPVRVAKYDKVHLLLRPGIEFSSRKDTPPTGPSVTTTAFDVTGEVEVEYWLTEKLSISASEGVLFSSSSDDQTPKTKDSGFQTTGNDFTTLGFHIYLW